MLSYLLYSSRKKSKFAESAAGEKKMCPKHQRRHFETNSRQAGKDFLPGPVGKAQRKGTRAKISNRLQRKMQKRREMISDIE
jgi:hypothetical protein